MYQARISGTLFLATLSIGLVIARLLQLGKVEAHYVLACGAVAFTLPLTVWWPRIAVFLHIALFLTLAASGTSLGIVYLATPLVIASITSQGQWRLAAIAIIVLLPASFYSARDQRFVFAIEEIILVSTFFALSIFGGIFARRATVEKQRTHDQIKRTQTELAILLHDSVVRDLTSIIVRLESLALRHPNVADEAQEIAEQSRNSIGAARTLIAQLQSTMEIENANSTPKSLASVIRSAAHYLTQRGFTATSRVNIPPTVTEFELIDTVLSQTLREVCTNVLKYAPKESDVMFDAVVADNTLQVSVTNAKASHRSTANSNHLGLTAAMSKLKSLGGDLIVIEDFNQWTTRISIPLTVNNRRVDQSD